MNPSGPISINALAKLVSELYFQESEGGYKKDGQSFSL
jgi:hypothetical protein